MVKIAFICGVPDLQFSSYGDYYFILTHLAIQNPQYLEFYKNVQGYKLLDNGAAELGKSVSGEQILDIAKQINANEICLPDELYQKQISIERSKQFLTTLSEQERSRYKFMAIPQGKNAQEWVECYNTFANMAEVSVLGISKYSIVECFKTQTGSDSLAVNRRHVLYSNFIKQNMAHHTLGGSDPKELTDLNLISWVRSYDSNIAYKAAHHQIQFDNVRGLMVEEPKQRLDFFKPLAASNQTTMFHNMAVMHKMSKGGQFDGFTKYKPNHQTNAC